MSLLQVVRADWTLGPQLRYDELEWRRPLRPAAVTGCTVSGHPDDLGSLRPGSYLVVREDRIAAWPADHLPIYRVEAAPYDTGAQGVPSVRVEAVPLTGYMGRVRVTPLGSEVDFGTDAPHDEVTAVPAETAIKHYWDRYAGPAAPPSREWPGLVIEPDQARGPDVTVAARGQSLTDVCAVPSQESGVGWEVVYRLAERDVMLRTVHGQSRPRVVFDVDRGTAQRIQLLEDDRPPNVAVVLGSGEGAARLMQVVWLTASEPTPPDRREIVVEASDATTVGQMRARGIAELRAGNDDFDTTDRARVEIDPLGRLPYRSKWDRGDVVTVRCAPRDFSKGLRVVDVIATDGPEGLSASAEIGLPWPSMAGLRELKEKQRDDHR